MLKRSCFVKNRTRTSIKKKKKIWEMLLALFIISWSIINVFLYKAMTHLMQNWGLKCLAECKNCYQSRSIIDQLTNALEIIAGIFFRIWTSKLCLLKAQHDKNCWGKFYVSLRKQSFKNQVWLYKGLIFFLWITFEGLFFFFFEWRAERDGWREIFHRSYLSFYL